MIDLLDIGEIKDLLLARYEGIKNRVWHENESLTPFNNQQLQEKVDEAWASYINGIDCVVLSFSEIRDDFQDIINYSSQGRVCIDMDDDNTPYILMPKELAQKIVVLGSLPDHWSPENPSR